MLASAFCLISMLTISVIVLLPTYLSDGHKVAPVAGGLLTTVISLLSVVGGVTASLLLHRGLSLRLLALTGSIIIPAAWLTFADGTGLWTTIAGSGAISLGNGLLVAVVFAGLPQTLTHLGHAGVGNGIVAQLGSLGSLLGPPLFGSIVANGGWSGVIPLIGLGVAGAIALLAALL